MSSYIMMLPRDFFTFLAFFPLRFKCIFTFTELFRPEGVRFKPGFLLRPFHAIWSARRGRSISIIWQTAEPIQLLPTRTRTMLTLIDKITWQQPCVNFSDRPQPGTVSNGDLTAPPPLKAQILTFRQSRKNTLRTNKNIIFFPRVVVANKVPPLNLRGEWEMTR